MTRIPRHRREALAAVLDSMRRVTAAWLPDLTVLVLSWPVGPTGRVPLISHIGLRFQRAYDSFFGAPVRFDKLVGLLRIPAGVLQRLLKDGGSPHLRQLAEAFVAKQLPEHQPRPTAPRVRAVIDQTMGTAPVALDAVAVMLSVHPRTLQRRLATEQTGFTVIVDVVRQHAASRYPTGTNLPATQIAALWGFSEQAAMARSCQRWWSAIPTSFIMANALVARFAVACWQAGSAAWLAGLRHASR